MRKLSLFMLMAVGLLISGNAWSIKPKGFQMNPDADGSVQKAPIRKAAQNEESKVRLQYGSFDQTFTGDRALQDAFDALPANSTPAFVTLLTDVNVPTAKTTVTMAQYHNVTLDLNGKNVYGATNVTGSAAVITNNGTLTIEDKVGGGSISNLEENPEDYEKAGKPYPSYAYNVITNNGTLTINGGYFVNYTNSNSSYVVDNYAGATLIINGGHIYNYHTNAIRLFCSTPASTLIMNDGFVEGYYAIWIQLEDGAKSSKANITINGGEIKSTAKCYNTTGTCTLKDAATCISDEAANGISDGANVNVTITGGVFNEGCNFCINTRVNVSGGIFNSFFCSKSDKTSITGGTYDLSEYTKYVDYITSFPTDDYETAQDMEAAGYTLAYWAEYGYDVYKLSSVTDNLTELRSYIADGYIDKHISGDIYEVVPIDQKVIEVSAGEQNLKDIVTVKEDGTTEITIIPNTTEDKQTIINITENTNVNKIEVTNKDEDGNKVGEAQIVVGTGVILNVGNGGIVSENDILTTVLVETGGTLVVGTGGVEQDGLATPIKIQTSETDGTGVLVFNPNSQLDNTQNYAEVDLYTYCKKIGDGKYTWQQFAIPVTGLDNSKVVKTPNQTSYVFEWDYATYSWSQLSDWAQLDEPFAGYDITNISEDGGVVYTFKGDLIGNQNIQLTLPHKDYCVMGNSYTAPIDIEALFEQINKEMSANTIEKTVYKYNAKAGYYVYTNELEQVLAKAGVMPASFTEIKPMEGFLLNLQNGNTAGVMLNYANAVFNPAMGKATGAKAPRQNNSTDLVVANINVMSAHSADRMTLVEGDEFSADIENGKDAFKYLNEGANLYAFDGTNKLAMVATDNLEGTMLAFQAAEDAEYTLTFDRALNTEYVLVDMMNGNEVAMTEGNTYTFFATPNTLDPARFMVKANAQAPTNMERTKATKVAKGIYTITGQYLGESNQWNAMPQGVYMVNGIKVIK